MEERQEYLGEDVVTTPERMSPIRGPARRPELSVDPPPPEAQPVPDPSRLGATRKR